MKKSPKRLLLLVVSVIALALVVAPASFAGEDDPGPTQAGETQGPSEGGSPSPAVLTGPGGEQISVNTGGSTPETQVLGLTETFKSAKNATTGTKDTVKAKGGIQAGFGGMAAQASSSTTLAGLVAVLFALAAAATLIPLRLRSQD